jgi:hypothetical protein
MTFRFERFEPLKFARVERAILIFIDLSACGLS